MQDTNAKTAETHAASPNTQDIGASLKKPFTVTAPMWVFGAAALAALALVGIALD